MVAQKFFRGSEHQEDRMGEAPKDCPAGKVCFYEGYNYDKLVRAEEPSNKWVGLPAFTSVYNHSEKKAIVVYDSKDGPWGDKQKVAPKSGDPVLSFKSYSYMVDDS
ncbi:peptidase inhibitor family I36 protein [Kitasatospora sp. NPDC101183]|uniref:peptidase inhibitor family I36 protein n=1 Tax=Kitasatospora sp. NPDC101183 TaxID=3364100 RepID=UPI00381DAA9C